MFRASSAHLQEDIVVYKQHMVPSLSVRVLVACWYAAIGSSPYSCVSTWCTDYYLFIKYYSPLNVSSIKCSSSGGHSCIQAAYVTVTLYKSPGGLLIRSYKENKKYVQEKESEETRWAYVARDKRRQVKEFVWINEWILFLVRLYKREKVKEERWTGLVPCMGQKINTHCFGEKNWKKGKNWRTKASNGKQ